MRIRIRFGVGARRPRHALGCALFAFLLAAAGCKQPIAIDAPAAPSCWAARPAVRPAPARPKVRPPVRPARPTVRALTLGESVHGTPLIMHIFGSRGPAVFIFGAIHGDEPTSRHVAEELVYYLRAHPELYRRRRVAVLPVANPDGLARGTRCNARGVDCNRNFPARNWRLSARTSRYYGGPRPGSEPETRAVIAAVQTLKPVRIVSIHSISSGRQCNNYDGPAKGVAELMASVNGYPPKASIGYPTPGSFGTWAGIERQIPTVTLELPSGAAGATVWRANRGALVACISGRSSSPVGR